MDRTLRQSSVVLGGVSEPSLFVNQVLSCWQHLEQKQWLPPHSQSRWLILFKCPTIMASLRDRLGGGRYCIAERPKNRGTRLLGRFFFVFFFPLKHSETDPHLSPVHFSTDKYWGYYQGPRKMDMAFTMGHFYGH